MEYYDKRPLTLDEQVELLKSRGLIFGDEERAKHHLSNISYYRLSAYMVPFRQRSEEDSGKVLDRFVNNATWEKVYGLYVFDRKLRLLVFDAIERLEIAVRTQVVYQLSHKYGSHWQDNPDIFTSKKKHKAEENEMCSTVYCSIQNYIKLQLHNKKSEDFVQHYCQKYSCPVNPPSWMIVEVMYFNHLSRICSGLKMRSDKSEIANYFSLPPDVFCSWLHAINYVRNICAHHARLWNRGLNIVPAVFYLSSKTSNDKLWISDPKGTMRGKIYYFLCILNFLLQTVNPTSSFSARLKSLLEDYEDIVPADAMGFPSGWKEEKMWNI